MLWELVRAGLLALQDYIALHVLTCLIPAFLLAGAMVTFVSKETIIYYLGAAAQKLKAFALAAGGSFFVAACSCTVIPVSSGLYYAGATIGAAFIVLSTTPRLKPGACPHPASRAGLRGRLTAAHRPGGRYNST